MDAPDTIEFNGVMYGKISDIVNDLEHHYDYDYNDPEKMEKLIQKWEAMPK